MCDNTGDDVCYFIIFWWDLSFGHRADDTSSFHESSRYFKSNLYSKWSSKIVILKSHPGSRYWRSNLELLFSLIHSMWSFILNDHWICNEWHHCIIMPLMVSHISMANLFVCYISSTLWSYTYWAKSKPDAAGMISDL